MGTDGFAIATRTSLNRRPTVTFSKTTLLALAASTMLASAVFAEEGGDKKPDAPKTDKVDKKEAKAKPIKWLPYSLIDSSLTADQREKITKIHQEALEETKKIKEKEDTDSLAVLNDDQKAKLKEAEEKKEADKKAKGGEKKTEEKKTEEKK
jgi:hypothetical protein